MALQCWTACAETAGLRWKAGQCWEALAILSPGRRLTLEGQAVLSRLLAAALSAAVEELQACLTRLCLEL